MPRGGPRPNSGRKPGAVVVATSEHARRLATDGGILPLEVLIKTMRLLWARAEEDKDEAARMAACLLAKDAAPYFHPRLAAVEHSGEAPPAVVVRVPEVLHTTEEWIERCRPRTNVQ
jgi:hypothetical protein